MVHKPVLLSTLLLALAGVACAGASQFETDAPPSGISGEEVFQGQGCSGCHVEGEGVVAPSLRGLFGTEVTLEGGEKVVADDGYLRESILSPGARTVQGFQPIMPEFEGRITEAQLEALILFIRAIPE